MGGLEEYIFDRRNTEVLFFEVALRLFTEWSLRFFDSGTGGAA
jgi:hypothetical protein